MLLADAKLENQNHKNQQKAVPESVNNYYIREHNN